MPFFSIIIPTYNRSNLVVEAISSVQEQSYSDWEIIIVDDGSIDNTAAVIRGIKDNRIRYYLQSHAERSAARNKGIDLANGDYICFLDDDDYYLPNHLQSLFDKIDYEETKIAVFRTGMIEKSIHKDIYGPLYKPSKDGHPVNFFLKNMAGIHTLCFHNTIFDQIRFDGRWFFYEDTHFLVRVLLKYKLFQINEYSAVYNISDQMGSYKAYTDERAVDLLENNIDAMRDLFDYCIDNYPEFNQNKNRMISAKYLEHAIAAIIFGNKLLGQIMYQKFKAGSNFFSFPKDVLKYWYYKITMR